MYKILAPFFFSKFSVCDHNRGRTSFSIRYFLRLLVCSLDYLKILFVRAAVFYSLSSAISFFFVNPKILGQAPIHLEIMCAMKISTLIKRDFI